MIEFFVMTEFQNVTIKSQYNQQVMSQQGSTKARNEDLRYIIFDRLTYFYRDNEFLCRDKMGAVHEKECRDILNETKFYVLTQLFLKYSYRM